MQFNIMPSQIYVRLNALNMLRNHTKLDGTFAHFNLTQTQNFPQNGQADT